MSLEQVYWEILHAEQRLGDFSNHIFMMDGVDTRLYNTQFISGLHRVMNARTWVEQLLGKAKSAAILADFQRETGGTCGQQNTNG